MVGVSQFKGRIEMKTQTAILIGFAFLAAANVLSPIVERSIITPANAEELGLGDYKMFSNRLADIATAIYGIQACR